MPRLNRVQNRALFQLWLRCLEPSGQNPLGSFRAFRRTVRGAIGMDCALVKWCGMWIGIEKDGYTHS